MQKLLFTQGSIIKQTNHISNTVPGHDVPPMSGTILDVTASVAGRNKSRWQKAEM
jgi:hypothetical protein